jgi:hypothetical protein
MPAIKARQPIKLAPGRDRALSETGIKRALTVQYSGLVNQRATSWLLAALMALCAAHAVPIASVERTGANCPIVWVARARSEQPAAVRRAVRRSHAALFIALADDPRANSSLFSKSLYQRPPPVLLS